MKEPNGKVLTRNVIEFARHVFGLDELQPNGWLDSGSTAERKEYGVEDTVTAETETAPTSKRLNSGSTAERKVTKEDDTAERLLCNKLLNIKSALLERNIDRDRRLALECDMKYVNQQLANLRPTLE